MHLVAMMTTISTEDARKDVRQSDSAVHPLDRS